MRFRFLLGGVIASASLGAFAFGCVDLFHSTDFTDDAGEGGTQSHFNGDPSTDFCAWDESTARQVAVDSCMLLAACQSPVGDNAPGTCIANATLAYDCAAVPNRPVIGPAHDYWACLSGAKTCKDVGACVYGAPPALDDGNGPFTCVAPGVFIACAPTGVTRVDCRALNALSSASSCLAEGQSCTADTVGALPKSCTGLQGLACTKSGCTGTSLSYCADAGGGVTKDIGVDCASFGTGQCVDSDAGGPSCMAVAAVDGGTCARERGIRCQNDVAHGCASGVLETVNCAALGTNCVPDPDGVTWDIASACAAKTPTCQIDVCSGDHLQACVRGNVVDIDCKALGLGACKRFDTGDGARYACGAP
ncbi:MAG: hypothetical protein ABI551_22845 [Polyangiaceae bacterium]